MMDIYMALSCYQGRPQWWAAEKLLSFDGVTGLQLTPGCIPEPGFAEWITRNRIPYRTHQGFSFTERKTKVWEDGKLLAKSNSVHAPLRKHFKDQQSFLDWWDQHHYRCLEIMPIDSYWLSCPDDFHPDPPDEYSDFRINRVAIDFSHLLLWDSMRDIDDMIDFVKWLDNTYSVYEIHLSHNEGDYDSHLMINADSPVLDILKGCGLYYRDMICEAYLHHASDNEIQNMIDTIRNT